MNTRKAQSTLSWKSKMEPTAEQHGSRYGVPKNVCCKKNRSIILDIQHVFKLIKKKKKAGKECGKDKKKIHIFTFTSLATFLGLFIMMFKSKNLCHYFKQADRLIKLTIGAKAAVW